MSGTASPADDSTRSDDAKSAPISPLLNDKLADLNPEVAQRVRDVVDRKGRRS